jgi:holliday junction DNA helicase RuvA
MIGKINGILIEISPPRIMIEVAGIGYEIDSPMSTIYTIGNINSNISLYTHLAIKEDAHNLYGFATMAEKIVFKELIKISGIGARTSLAILSGLNIHEIIQSIQQNNLSLLSTIPGIGKKTAERLILEMSSKIKILQQAVLSNNDNQQSNQRLNQNSNYSANANNINQQELLNSSLEINQASISNQIYADTLSALLSLGYGEKEANSSISKVIKTNNNGNINDLSAMIKQALKILSKS